MPTIRCWHRAVPLGRVPGRQFIEAAMGHLPRHDVVGQYLVFVECGRGTAGAAEQAALKVAVTIGVGEL